MASLPKVPQPKNLHIKLFPHQLMAIHKLEKLEKERVVKKGDEVLETNVGVVGDKPGAGKSLEVIGMLCRSKTENKEMKETHVRKQPLHNDYYGLFSMYRRVKFENIDCDLIVCSPSIAKQWEEELDKSDLVYNSISKRSEFEFDPNDFDVVLITSNIYNEFVLEFHEFAWRRFIYDEATSTHIKKMEFVVANFYWFITATYQALTQGTSARSKGHMINTIFRNIPYGVIDMIVVKIPDDIVDKSCKVGEPKYKIHKCINPQMMNILQNFVDPHIMQMLSAGDIGGVIKSMGGNEDSEDNIINILKSKKQMELEEAEGKVTLYTGKVGYETYLQEWKTRVTKYKSQIKDIEDRFNSLLEDDCSICYSEMSKPVMIKCCQTIYCGECLATLLKNKQPCPNCRSPITNKSLTQIKEAKSPSKEEKEEKKSPKGKGKVEKKENKPKSKPDTIVSILKDKKYKKGKFIIFSDYDASFRSIRSALTKENIKFVEIKGQKKTRENNIEKYKSGDVNVLFLNSKFNGAGINLQVTTNIILYHSMSPHIEKQVVGRVKRIGKKDDFTVHRLTEDDGVAEEDEGSENEQSDEGSENEDEEGDEGSEIEDDEEEEEDECSENDEEEEDEGTENEEEEEDEGTENEEEE